MDKPLDEYALDFIVDDDTKRLVKDMLKAVVDHPDIYSNGFEVKNLGNGSFEYFLGGQGRPGPFLNSRRLPHNITDALVHYGIAGPKINPQWPDSFRSFTEEALEWQRRFGGPEPDEVRRRIGRLLERQLGGQGREYRIEEVAQEIGVSEERVRKEIHILVEAGFIERALGGDAEFGVLGLGRPTGVLWAAAGFPPIHTMPLVREPPLSSLPSLVRQSPRPAISADDRRSYDVFISHASEDKDAVVRPLADALVGHGLAVWYDEFELRIGDSLRQKIDQGLANSRFGIVVLSGHFFEKGWPNHELDGLATKSVGGDQVILPIWHNISKEQVIAYSPPLADKVARRTSNHTIDEIAAEIANVVRASRPRT